MPVNRKSTIPLCAGYVPNVDKYDDEQELRLRSNAIKQSPSGKLSVDICLLSRTRKFQDDLKALKKIEAAFYRRKGLPTPS